MRDRSIFPKHFGSCNKSLINQACLGCRNHVGKYQPLVFSVPTLQCLVRTVLGPIISLSTALLLGLIYFSVVYSLGSVHDRQLSKAKRKENIAVLLSGIRSAGAQL